MTKLFRREYNVNSKPLLFEIGYRFPEKGCDYVLNRATQQLERILSIDFGFNEGRSYVRVETSRDVWYEVDGSTVFARILEVEEQSHLAGLNGFGRKIARATTA